MNRIIIYFLTVVSIGVISCGNKKNVNTAGPDIKSEDGDQLMETSVDNKKQTLTATEFIKWCANADNHLNKTKEISELKYNLSFMPAESMAFLELRTEQYDYETFKSACNHYTDMTYFNLKIELPQGSGEILKYKLQSPSQYEKRVKYISYDMQNDIYLIQGTDTLRPGLYQYERIFEVAPYATLMMGFDNKKFDKEKEFTFCYNDKLFEKGYIKFNYKNGQLVNVPNIIGL